MKRKIKKQKKSVLGSKDRVVQFWEEKKSSPFGMKKTKKANSSKNRSSIPASLGFPSFPSPVKEEKREIKHRLFYLTLAAAIFAIAILARTYHLSTLPPGVYPDEAVNGTDAIKANETGHYQWFYPNNYGREGLFINLIALGFKFFGVSVITLKMWSVLFGVLTIAGVMLLARELFGTYRAGLIAGFLYATSFWAINFNRISFRANMLPFVLVFTFYFLFKGLREKKFYDYILAGLFFGLGIHGYIAFRIAPVILVALFFAFLISQKRFLREYWKPILAFFFSALLVALPMLLTFYFHPEYFETRSESVSIFSPKVNQGHFWLALGKSTALTLGMFNFHGDQNWRHNFPSQPELQSWTGIFFLIGIALLFYYSFYWLYQRMKLSKFTQGIPVRFFAEAKSPKAEKKALTQKTYASGIRRREIKTGKRSFDFVISVLLLSWLFAMLLPGILTYEGLPHALRTIGALPAALLVVTFAIEKIFNLLDNLPPKKFRFPLILLGYTLLIFLIVWSGLVGLKTYFIDWANAPQIHAAFSQNFKNMALYLNNLPKNVNKYVVANAGGQIMDDGLPVSAEVVKLLTHYPTPGITFTRPADLDPQKIQTPAKVVLMYYDGEVIAKIKSVFPKAYVQKMDPQPGNGTDYYVVNVY